VKNIQSIVQLSIFVQHPIKSNKDLVSSNLKTILKLSIVHYFIFKIKINTFKLLMIH